MSKLAFNTGFLGEAEGQFAAHAAATVVDGRNTGYKAYRLAPAAAASEASYQLTPASSRHVVTRFYFRLTALPVADTTLWANEDNHSVDSAFFWRYRVSDGRLVLEWRAANVAVETSEGPVIDVDRWYRFDSHFVGSSVTAEEGFDSWMIDGAEFAAVRDATYDGTLVDWIFGSALSQTFELEMTDFIIVYGSAAADDADIEAAYPFGAGHSEILRPASVGTNVNEASFDPSSGTIADSWNLLDNVPMDTTTGYLEQNVIGTGDYIEYVMTDLDGAPVINCASYFQATRSSTLSANNAKLHIIDGATDNTVFNGAMLDTSSPWGITREGVPVTGADEFDPDTWTADRINALLMRWGYSSDVDGIPRVPALAIEVDVVDAGEVGGGSWWWWRRRRPIGVER